MKHGKRIINLAKWLFTSKHDKAKEQILRYAEYTIQHTEVNVGFANGSPSIGFKFKAEI